jgi:thioredoxin 2
VPQARFVAIAEGATIPVLVVIWAPWCAPCRWVGPALDRLARDLAGQVKLAKVNVHEAPRLQARFAVAAVATLMLLCARIVAYRASAPPEPM